MGDDGTSDAASAGKIVGALGAIAVFGSTFLNWVDTGRGEEGTLKGTDIPVEFLVNTGKLLGDGPSLLLLLGVAAALIAVGLYVKAAHRYSAMAGALLALLVVVLYCVQVQRRLDGPDDALDLSLTDFISIGTYLALAGGVAALISAFMAQGEAEAAPSTEATPGAPPGA